MIKESNLSEIVEPNCFFPFYYIKYIEISNLYIYIQQQQQKTTNPQIAKERFSSFNDTTIHYHHPHHLNIRQNVNAQNSNIDGIFDGTKFKSNMEYLLMALHNH